MRIASRITGSSFNDVVLFFSAIVCVELDGRGIGVDVQVLVVFVNEVIVVVEELVFLSLSDDQRPCFCLKMCLLNFEFAI